MADEYRQARGSGAKRVPGRPPPLPPCPEGWSPGPPDFVGVGAQRCGTTWWFRQLTEHPGTCFEPALHYKELHFFNWLPRNQELSEAARAEYERYFPRPREAGLVGEWTPCYMHVSGSLSLLAQAVPDAKVLVMLRDPVSRYRSGVGRQRRFARERGERDAPAEALEDQRARGLYAPQVERVLELFPLERVLVLQYERCLVSYEEERRRTYAFLGLDPEFRIETRRFLVGEPTDRPAEAGETELAELYAADAARLVRLVPEIDLALWPSVAQLV